MTPFDLIGIIIISVLATIFLIYITILFLVSVKSEKEKQKFFREKFIKLKKENEDGKNNKITIQNRGRSLLVLCQW